MQIAEGNRGGFVAAAVTAGTIHAAEIENGKSVEDLITRLKSADENVRGRAWQSAGPYGAKAVSSLAKLMADADFEVARSARRALENVVRHAGRPRAENERLAVQRELLKLLEQEEPGVRKEAAWMLSEIGDEKAVSPLASLLRNPEVREDARCALLRMPRKAALGALKRAFKQAPEDFKYALADSLRALGEQVDGWPSRKLEPTQKTSVEPVTRPSKEL